MTVPSTVSTALLAGISDNFCTTPYKSSCENHREAVVTCHSQRFRHASTPFRACGGWCASAGARHGGKSQPVIFPTHTLTIRGGPVALATPRLGQRSMQVLMRRAWLYQALKNGSSVLDSSYQLRLQTYGSLINDMPFTIYTSRPVNPAFQGYLTRWGVSVQPLP